MTRSRRLKYSQSLRKKDRIILKICFINFVDKGVCAGAAMAAVTGSRTPFLNCAFISYIYPAVYNDFRTVWGYNRNVSTVEVSGNRE